jgi:hypothetical protein
LPTLITATPFSQSETRASKGDNVEQILVGQHGETDSFGQRARNASRKAENGNRKVVNVNSSHHPKKKRSSERFTAGCLDF